MGPLQEARAKEGLPKTHVSEQIGVLNNAVAETNLFFLSIGQLVNDGVVDGHMVEVNAGSLVLEVGHHAALGNSGHVSVVLAVPLLGKVFFVECFQIVDSQDQVEARGFLEGAGLAREWVLTALPIWRLYLLT